MSRRHITLQNKALTKVYETEYVMNTVIPPDIITYKGILYVRVGIQNRTLVYQEATIAAILP